MLAVYDDTTDRWRLSLIDIGESIPVAHSGGDYTAYSVGTWTVESGDLQTHIYRQYGKIVEITLLVSTSTIATTAPTILLVALPNGFTIDDTQVVAFGRSLTPAIVCVGGVAAAISTTQWFIQGYDGVATFTVGTNTLSVQGTIRIEVD